MNSRTSTSKKSGKPNYKNIEIYVIKKAQFELDKVSPYTFNYQFSKDYSTIEIVPVFQSQFSNAKYERKKKDVNLLDVLTEREITTLTEFGFTEQGLKNNYGLFEQAKKVLPENYSFFWFQQIKKSRKNNSPAYIIGILRNLIADYNTTKP